MCKDCDAKNPDRKQPIDPDRTTPPDSIPGPGVDPAAWAAMGEELAAKRAEGAHMTLTTQDGRVVELSDVKNVRVQSNEDGSEMTLTAEGIVEPPPEARPRVELTWPRMFCALHAEPMREQYPKGVSIFAARALSWAIKDPKFAEQCAGDIMQTERLLDEKPLCCRISTAELEQCYVESGVGIMNKCRICGDRRPGTRYRDASRGVIPHICFRCVSCRIELGAPHG